MKNIIKTVALITIFSGLAKVAGFLFRIYLSRTIGAESLGIYQIAFSLYIVFITLTASGLPLTISRLTAKYETLNNHNKKYSFISTALIIGAISSLLLCLIVFIFNKWLGFIFTDFRCVLILLVLMPSVVFNAVFAIFRGVFWGQNKYLKVCIVELCEQIVRIIVCVILINLLLSTVEGSLIASISLSFATLVSLLLISILYFKQGGKLKKYNKEDAKELIKTSTPITGLKLVSSLLAPIIAILIPLGLTQAGYTNSQALTLYGLAMGMAFPLLYLPNTLIDSLAVALIPDLASALALNNDNYIKNRIKNSINFTFFTACVCVPIFMALGEPICLFIFNSSLAGIFLSYASILMVPMSLNCITSTILNSINLEKKSLKNYLIGSVLLIAIIILLPAYLGINTIILAMFVSTLVTSVLNINTIVKSTNIRLNFFKEPFYLLLCIIPSTLITANIYSLCSMYFTLTFSLLISIIVAFVSYILICDVFNIITFEIFISYFKNKKKKTAQT